MDFHHSARALELQERVRAFIAEHVAPRDGEFHAEVAARTDRWALSPIIEALKPKAKAAGLWNLFMPPWSGARRVDESFAFDSPGLSNLEYAPLAELMGHHMWCSEVFNCAAPDTGNMEVLERYGSAAQKAQWLAPLMRGEIRSAFCMTEPEVASADATNIATSVVRDGDHYVINGRKWWSTGVGHRNCRILIVMGKSDPGAPTHQQQSMVLVPLDTPGVTVERMLPVFGYDDAWHGGHGQVLFDNVRVPAANMLLGEGRGFEIAQGRLGPGRIHHCMRTIGMAEAALEKMAKRLLARTAFGKRIGDHSPWAERLADARIEIEMTRLLCLKAAFQMDTAGNKAAQLDIAMIKVAAPRMALKVIDDAMQAFGGAGVCADFGLAEAYAGVRTLRLADGPDEVHQRAISRIELKRYAGDNFAAVAPVLEH